MTSETSGQPEPGLTENQNPGRVPGQAHQAPEGGWTPRHHTKAAAKRITDAKLITAGDDP